MKFTTEITIDLPRQRVIELFDNPDNLAKWQSGLREFVHISGETGMPGAKSRLLYKVSGREVEMIETITVRNLPDEFSGTYEAKGVWNEVKNFFFEDGPGKTRWVSENEFRFKGLMAVMGFLMPGSFRKETQKQMNEFKRFAENEG